MEQKQNCCGPVSHRLPPRSANHPWLVKAEEDTGDQIFYNIHDPALPHYHCRIPELTGRRIRARFHGWVILSKHLEWSLWNPVTSKFIRLPPLILKDVKEGDYEVNCCLTSPPDDPSSILLLLRVDKPKIVFCRPHHKRKRLRWTEMSYAKQLMGITGGNDDVLLFTPSCCNGKVYALNTWDQSVILVDIVVKDTEVVISLLPFANFNYPSGPCLTFYRSLNGSCTELFIIFVAYDVKTMKEPYDVHLFKLDMISRTWDAMVDLKDTIFFMDLVYGCSSPPIASELGGNNIHILGKTGKIIFSYHIKDKTISISSLPCLDLPPISEALRTSHISMWAMPRLQGDNGEAKCTTYDSKQEEDKEDEIVVRSITNDEVESNSVMNETQEQNIEAHMLNIPFHVLEMIMEHCVGVEYLNFRATCKHCHLAAPPLRWSKGTALRRLQTYSLVSPWLMVFDKDRGIITFTDPLFGGKYFTKTFSESIRRHGIFCSRYGWLLIFSGFKSMVFFNPFTSDIHELPEVPNEISSHTFTSLCFSAPPTSPGCMVVGFTQSNEHTVWICIYILARETPWRIFCLNGDDPFHFPTFYGRDLYVLSNEGGLDVFVDIDEDFSWEVVVAEAPRSCCRSSARFLVKCDQHLLLVIVGEFGEQIEVLKLDDSTGKWEKINGIGRHMIYICGTTCLCVAAKTSEMENKIYFPRFHLGNGKIVFYSLETCKYHTFNGKKVEETFTNFFATKRPTGSYGWIEPSWS